MRFGRPGSARSVGAAGSPSFIDIASGLARMARVNTIIGSYLAPLGPIAPSVVAVPYREMRNGLGNAVANLYAAVEATAEGDEREIQQALVGIVANEIVNSPPVDLFWPAGPPKWMYGYRPSAGLGGFWTDGAIVPYQAYLEENWPRLRQIDWWGVYVGLKKVQDYGSGAAAMLFSLPALGGTTAGLNIYLIGNFVGTFYEELVNKLRDQRRTQEQLGADPINEYQRLVAKFHGEYLPGVYQPLRRLYKLMRNPSFPWIADGRLRTAVFVKSMVLSDPWTEPAMPTGWDGMFPDLSDRSVGFQIAGVSGMIAALAMIAKDG